MKKTLINYLGWLGILSLISYTAAVVFSPLAYPGYDWKSQAVSDLSATNAPSLGLWHQLNSLYLVCGILSATLCCIFVVGQLTRTLRLGIYLFAVMTWVSGLGYAIFPLSNRGYGDQLQDVMHLYLVTPLTVLLSILSLILIMVGGYYQKQYLSLAVCASIAFTLMLVGAIGTGAAPKEIFGVFERFSVFAASGFNAVLGIHLFLGFKGN